MTRTLNEKASNWKKNPPLIKYSQLTSLNRVELKIKNTSVSNQNSQTIPTLCLFFSLTFAVRARQKVTKKQLSDD